MTEDMTYTITYTVLGSPKVRHWQTTRPATMPHDIALLSVGSEFYESYPNVRVSSVASVFDSSARAGSAS